MICMQRSAHSCEICVELLAGISVLEYAFCTRHNSHLSIYIYIYICMYVCIYIYVYTYASLGISVHV